MTKYYYTCEKDKKLIDKSFENIANIIFGKKNSNTIADFKDFWEKKVSNVNVFPQGSIHEKINPITPGICRLDQRTNKFLIEMYGYNGAKSGQFSWIKHEGTHEFCHSFVNLLPLVMSEHKNGIIKNGIQCDNDAGIIKETDPKTGKFVGQRFYGKMFNETMMDIITSIAINYFDSDNNSKTVNDILNNNYNDWGNEKTGYSIFTSITRLTIAAFANAANTNYDSIVKSGLGIFNLTTKLKNGKQCLTNDFLYGIVFDPLHIEEEFDKYMGDGYYRIFCECLDRLFLLSLNKQKLPSDAVKRIMYILPDFLNKKMNYYREENLIERDIANQIRGNFNHIWNSMQEEYDSYFSDDDIKNIARNAGRKV